MRVSDLPNSHPEEVELSITLREVSRLMTRRQHHAVAVVDGIEFVGVFTEYDLMVAVADGADVEIAQVRDWMTGVPDAISGDISVGEALRWMIEGQYRHLPLTDEVGTLTGMISMRDLVGGALKV